MKKNLVILAILVLAAFPALAGEWHTGQNNLCADCHTMHNSMSHTWDGTGTVSTTPAKDGNWTPGGGPGGNYLLKAADPNALCLACHDNQTFAPDVLGATKTANDATNRSAGYLNASTDAVKHTGHTLGYIGPVPGNTGTFATDATHGLECINCHTQHGQAGIYRNLGPRGASLPTYALNGRQPVDITGRPIDLTAAQTAADVDIFIDAAGYAPNTSNFAAFYETANVKYLKRTVAAGEVENRSGNQCAACHGGFHGAVSEANIGGEPTTGGYDKFNRHPVGGVVVGSLSGGHSWIGKYNGGVRYGVTYVNNNKIKVYADDQAAFTDATPGCISCHKAHGNGQPFGLVFAETSAAAGSMTEEGTIAANAAPTAAQTAEGQRALCGQCHVQGK